MAVAWGASTAVRADPLVPAARRLQPMETLPGNVLPPVRLPAPLQLRAQLADKQQQLDDLAAAALKNHADNAALRQELQDTEAAASAANEVGERG